MHDTHDTHDTHATPLPFAATAATAALLDGVRDACFVLDVEGRLTYLNNAAAAMLGVGRDAAIGQFAVSLLPPTEGDAFGTLLRVVIAGGAVGETTVHRVQAGTSLVVRVWREGDAILVRSRDSHPMSEGTMFERERRARRIADTASSFLTYLDHESRFRFVNATAARLFGRAETQMEGQTFAAVFGAEAYAHQRPNLERALRGETVRYRTRFPVGEPNAVGDHAGGREFETVLTPDIDAAGQVRGVVSVSTDVTDLVRAREAARQNEQQVRLILDSTSAAVTLFDLDERCKYANPTALAGLGRTAAEVIGQPFMAMVGPTVYALVRTQLARALRGERVQFYVHIPEGPGTAHLPIAGRDFIMVYTPEVDAAGAMRGVVAVNTDVTDHMRAEEAVRRSEERYRSLATATASIVWVANREGMVVRDLIGWEAYTGQTTTEYREHGWLAAIHPDDVHIVRERWQRASGVTPVTPVTPVTHEFRLRRRDGVYRMVVARGVPVFASDGSVREWIGTITDIHDARQAETERAVFAARLLALFRAENLGIAWGEGEVVSEANDAFLRITGYDRADVTDGTLRWRAFTPPEDALRMRQAVADSIAYGWVAPFAQTFVRKDGGRVSVVLGGSCLNPDPFRFLIFIFDDTERANTEAALRNSEERYRLAAQAVAGLLYDYDRAAGRVTYSTGLRDLLGYDPAEVPQEPAWWKAQTHPDDHTQVQAVFDAAMNDCDTPRYRMEYRVRHRDGHDVWVWDRGYFVRDAAGVVTRVVGNVVDVSEQVRAGAEMRRLQEDAVRLRDEFLASVSHELRTPLTALRAGLGLLDDSSQSRLEEAERGLLRNARRNVAHLARLVDDLVVFNQVKEHRLQLEMHPLDLHVLIAEVVASMDILLSRKRQTVALTLDTLPLVAGDSRRLRQVFVNLLDNAHRHTPDSTAITVRGWEDTGTGEVVVSIEDTGAGIAEPQRERIFERSFVGGGITSGTGLGLAIARSIVELHGGTIHIEAAPSGGAAFVLRLRRANDMETD